MNNENEIAYELGRIAEKINPFQEPYSDYQVGKIGCVVEGQIAIAKGLFAIADAIQIMSNTMESIAESK